MASTYLRADSAHVIRPNQFPPAAAARIAARMLNLYSPREIANVVETLMDLLDIIDRATNPDEPDFSPCSDGLPGDPGDHESAGDEKDCAWIEWTQLPPSLRRAQNVMGTWNEDDEDGGDLEQDVSGDLPVPEYRIDQSRGPIGHELV